MKMLIDMNMSPRWENVMTDAGLEAVHWSAIGAINAPDIEIMAFAKANDYTVITHDLDFSAILAATGGDKPSVVQIRAGNLSPEVLGDHVVNALRQLTSDLDAGALLTIGPGNARVRLLPLHQR